jgi:hypothetical protein
MSLTFDRFDGFAMRSAQRADANTPADIRYVIVTMAAANMISPDETSRRTRVDAGARRGSPRCPGREARAAKHGPFTGHRRRLTAVIGGPSRHGLCRGQVYYRAATRWFPS